VTPAGRGRRTGRVAGRSPRPRAGGAHGNATHTAAPPRPVACAIITVSDTRRGAADLSGAHAALLIERSGHRVVTRAWVSDDARAIRRVLRDVLARPAVDVAVITGGTGIAPRDRTPEAVGPLVDRWLPGFGELVRAQSVVQVGMAAWLSRVAAGVAGGRLVVMLPGSRAAVDLALTRVLLPELAHAVRLLGRFREE
jgi:molybdopterin adenylyltransferase